MDSKAAQATSQNAVARGTHWRMLHCLVPHHARGEEEHGETLAAALRVPDPIVSEPVRLIYGNSPLLRKLDGLVFPLGHEALQSIERRKFVREFAAGVNLFL